MASKTVTRSLKITINDKEIDNSITKINKEIRQLRKNLAAANNPEDRKKYNAELEKAYQARKNINEEIRGTQGLLSKLKKQLGPAGIAMGAAFSAAAITAFAGKLIDTIKLFRELKHETKLLTGLQGKMLDQAVAGTKALADTFDTDYKENLIAANTLVKNYGVSYGEALDVMEKGYLSGANVSGDMLNQIKEYAPLMKEANLQLDQMVSLIAQTSKEGVFNDKGIDAIKEGMLRIREGTSATRTAINKLGIDSTKLYNDIQDGSTSYFEAMQLVSTKLNEIGDQSPAIGTAIADIFGGPGEDAGLKYLKTLKDLDLNLNNLVDTQDEYTRLKKEEIEVNKRLNDTWVKLTSTGGLFNKISIVAKDILADILSGFINLNKILDDNNTKVEKERFNLLLVQSKINDVNTSNKERIKLINQLKKDYPELLKNIDAEKVSNTELNISIKNVNDQLINKIIIEKKGAEFADQAEKAALRRIDLIKQEQVVRSQLTKLMDDNNIKWQTGNDITKQTEFVINKLGISAGRLIDPVAEISHQLSEYKIVQNDVNDSVEKSNELLIEKNNLIKKFKLSSDILNVDPNIDPNADPNVDPNTTEQDRLANKAAQNIEAHTLDLQNIELNASEIKDLEIHLETSKNKELTKIKDKYRKGDLKSEKKLHIAKLNLQNDILNGAIDLAGKETRVGKALIVTKQLLAAKEMLINLGVFQAKAATAVGEATTATAVGAANTAKVGFPQNIPLLIAFAVQAAAIIATVKSAISSAKSTSKKSFAVGGFTGSGFGFTDKSGHQPVGVVHDNEYVVPKFVLQDSTDPSIPAVMQYLEAKRTGQSFADGGETSPNTMVTDVIPEVSGNLELTTLMSGILYRLENPLPSPAFFDNEQANKVNQYQTEVEQARNGAIIL